MKHQVQTSNLRVSNPNNQGKSQQKEWNTIDSIICFFKIYLIGSSGFMLYSLIKTIILFLF